MWRTARVLQQSGEVGRRYVLKVKPERFAQFAENVMGISSGESAEETAIAGIEALENFFRELHMPTKPP